MGCLTEMNWLFEIMERTTPVFGQTPQKVVPIPGRSGASKACRGDYFYRRPGLAGELGFEPRQTESESVVLPLHHSPPKRLNLQSFLRKFCSWSQEFCKPGTLQGPYTRAGVRGLVP